MEQINTTVEQIDEYIRSMDEGTSPEKEVYSQLFNELLSVHKTVSHKDIIAGLIQKLETEQDVIKADIYRHMLEIMLQSPNSQ